MKYVPSLHVTGLSSFPPSEVFGNHENKAKKKTECKFGFSFAYQMFQFGVDKGKAGKSRLVHGVDEVLVNVGESRLFAQELSVKVAAVTGGFLWTAGESEGESRIQVQVRAGAPIQGRSAK